MGDTKISQVDKEVLGDLRDAERLSTFFERGPMRPEFWEVFLALRHDRELVQSEVRRLTALRDSGQPRKVEGPILDRLKEVRTEHYGLAVQLRQFLQSLPQPPEGMHLELAIVFIMASPKARESASSWTGDPLRGVQEAGARLRIMKKLSDDYCQALLEARRDEVPTPAEAPTPPAPEPPKLESVPIAPPAPELFPPAPVVAPPEQVVKVPELLRPGPPDVDSTIRVHPQFIEDLRRVKQVRQLLQGPKGAPELWELVALVTTLRDETRRSIADLERLKVHGKPGEFPAEAYNFREKVARVREKYGVLVSDLRPWLLRLFGKWEGEVEELALALVIATMQGRHRVKAWVGKPDGGGDEAKRWMEALLSRARGYLDALAPTVKMPAP